MSTPVPEPPALLPGALQPAGEPEPPPEAGSGDVAVDGAALESAPRTPGPPTP